MKENVGNSRRQQMTRPRYLLKIRNAKYNSKISKFVFTSDLLNLLDTKLRLSSVIFP